MICPVGWGRAFLSVLWEDSIKPKLIRWIVGGGFLFMGMVASFLVLLLIILAYKFTSGH